VEALDAVHPGSSLVTSTNISKGLAKAIARWFMGHAKIYSGGVDDLRIDRASSRLGSVRVRQQSKLKGGAVGIISSTFAKTFGLDHTGVP